MSHLTTALDELLAEITNLETVSHDALTRREQLMTPYQALVELLDGADTKREAVNTVKAALPTVRDTPAKPKGGKPTKQKCPHCPREFDSAQGVKLHQVRAHGSGGGWAKRGGTVADAATNALTKLGAHAQIAAAIERDETDGLDGKTPDEAEITAALKAGVLPANQLIIVADGSLEYPDDGFADALKLARVVVPDGDTLVYTCDDCDYTTSTTDESVSHALQEHGRARNRNERRQVLASEAASSAA